MKCSTLYNRLSLLAQYCLGYHYKENDFRINNSKYFSLCEISRKLVSLYNNQGYSREIIFPFEELIKWSIFTVGIQNILVTRNNEDIPISLVITMSQTVLLLSFFYKW